MAVKATSCFPGDVAGARLSTGFEMADFCSAYLFVIFGPGWKVPEAGSLPPVAASEPAPTSHCSSWP